MLGMLLLQACGQNSAAEGRGEAFAAVAEAQVETGLLGDAQATPVAQAPAETTQASTAQPALATALPAVSSTPAGGKSAGGDVRPQGAVNPAAESTGPAADRQSGKPGAIATDATAPGTPKPAATPSSAAAVTQRPAGQTGTSVAGKAAISPTPGPGQQAVSPAALPAASPAQSAAAVIPAHDGFTSIDWNGFFDGSDQTRPSEHFWDLSGSTVKIKGFMGEVLSFEKNWFLLIPEPGAECPFDNGDETYWNKIMIVFVPGGDKLRYTSGPLEITGRLDVGIKIDESGYKTMFRLYDASFKSL
ncbi:hypothetical protein R70723_29840 [Paenibacillus sp. FSL R7-0273]|nr:hypothetical protein R70723_29840 [Paenibacillus sp. FSL R7-0273]